MTLIFNFASTALDGRSTGRIFRGAAILVTSMMVTTGCAVLSGGTATPDPDAAETAAPDDEAAAGERAALLDDSRPLESGEILAIVANNTLNHGPFQEYYAADGTVSGRIDGGDLYSGLWAIDTDGRVCTQLPEFGAQGCAAVFATPDNELLFVTPDDRVTVLTVESGDRVTEGPGTEPGTETS